MKNLNKTTQFFITSLLTIIVKLKNPGLQIIFVYKRTKTLRVRVKKFQIITFFQTERINSNFQFPRLKNKESKSLSDLKSRIIVTELFCIFWAETSFYTECFLVNARKAWHNMKIILEDIISFNYNIVIRVNFSNIVDLIYMILRSNKITHVKFCS